MSGACGTGVPSAPVWRTTTLLAAIVSKSFVRRSIVASMSVNSRPNELALVTGRPSTTQLYAWCV